MSIQQAPSTPRGMSGAPQHQQQQQQQQHPQQQQQQQQSIPRAQRDLSPQEQELVRAVRDGELERMKKTAKQIKNWITQEYERGYTLLHEAVEFNKPHLVQYLLSKAPTTNGSGGGAGGGAGGGSVNYIDRRTLSGDTALHICCRLGFTEMAVMLVSKGAQIDVVNNDKRSTPLHYLVQHRYVPKSAPPEGVRPEPDHFLELFEILTRNKSVLDKQTSDGQSALHVSVRCGNFALIKMLLKASCQVYVLDSSGSTPLHLLMSCNGSDVVDIAKLMLESVLATGGNAKLQDFIDEINFKGASALQMALTSKARAVSALLISQHCAAEQRDLDDIFARLHDLPEDQFENIKPSTVEYALRETLLGRVFHNFVRQIRKSYSVTMYHSNPVALQEAAKATIEKFDSWLNSRLEDSASALLIKDTLFLRTYEVIFRLYQETNKNKDFLMQHKMGVFADLSYREFAIPEESWRQNSEGFERAIQKMREVSADRTPRAKIAKLNEAADNLARSGADDLTPRFALLIIQAQIEALNAEFEYMDDFKDDPDQERYLLLLGGSIDFLFELCNNIRNNLNQVMTLQTLVQETLHNVLSLSDELYMRDTSSGGDTVGTDLMFMQLLMMMCANRSSDEELVLPGTFSAEALKSFNFQAIMERMGLRVLPGPKTTTVQFIFPYSPLIFYHIEQVIKVPKRA